MPLLEESLVPLALACLTSNRRGALLIVLPDTAAMERCAIGLADFCDIIGETRRILPMPEVAPQRNMWIPENEAGRCAVLQAALSGENAIYLATPSVLLSQTLAPKTFKSNSFSLKKGMEIDLEDLTGKLVELDYDNEIEVHIPGEFSKRGGIVDLYSPLYEAPVRIEFWGNEIDSIRFFNPNSQRSYKDADEIKVVPRGTALLGDEARETTSIRSFFKKDICTAFVNQDRFSGSLLHYFDMETVKQWEEMESSFSSPINVQVSPEDTNNGSNPLKFDALSLEANFSKFLPELGESAAVWQWQQLRDAVRRWNASGYTVVACCNEKGEEERFRQLLAEHKETPEAKRGKPATMPIIIENQHLECGLMLLDAKVVLLSSGELFGRKTNTRRKKAVEYKHENTLAGDVELEEGSYVVHASYGIAIYHGIQRITSGGDVQEVMQLEFAGEKKLYVPLEQSYLVSHYLGAGKAAPKLSSLSSPSWRRAKDEAEKSAVDLAAELIKMEALRENAKGDAMKPVPEWERSFANSFPYAETPDQTSAIADVLADMEKDKPMDRLLCGDVGYGKTEVAIRAAFRAVLNGRQVAVLAPTTILAQQHYNSFKERMAEYPVRIEVLSRFKTKSQQEKILVATATGEVDILIGTHRIVQDDVHFRRLGLLVIDEEQRFGVVHKQRLKEMRADIDILTMTATPIPRTLYFSLSGIRNLSTIATPPADRLPVTTVVAKFDKQLIELAIKRELERGGQVFFLYNRVATIAKIGELVKSLVPEANVAVAHGKMHEHELEKIILDFVERKIDVLVCTTIVESGVDMPNVNTIIIDRADRYGLSDLYQLRGRVGRNNKQAYAYMLLPPMGALAQNARERLAAIRRYSGQGAGFRLALRDLEIRGAGNILGVEQSGHIAAVGFELYCSLLKDAIKALDVGRRKIQKLQCKLVFDRLTFALSSSNGRTCVCIPEVYIPEVSLRIDCYKRIASAESTKALDDLKLEFKDRFGEIPVATLVLFEYHYLRIEGTKAELVSISAVNDKLVIETKNGIWRDAQRQLPILTSFDGREQLAQARQFVASHFSRSK
ncbi:MAG: transcription-repair coupling factor [Victivallales bacterium]|nr:transcription-repair coupling factor [Victivallales bacterium]